MAPIRQLTSRITLLAKRNDHLTSTWWVLGGAVVVFAIVCALGTYVVCFRDRKHKQAQKLRAQRVSIGKCTQLDDKESIFEQEMQLNSDMGIAKSERACSVPESRDSRSQNHSRHNSNLDIEAQRTRSRSVGPAPNALMLEARHSRCRSVNPAPKLLSIGNYQHEIFLPAPSHSREHSRSRSLSHPVEDDLDNQRPQHDRTRSASTVSLVMSRNASMLQSRSPSPSPCAMR